MSEYNLELADLYMFTQKVLVGVSLFLTLSPAVLLIVISPISLPGS